MRDYLQRINKYCRFKAVGTAAMIYIDRLMEKHPEIVLTSHTVHRLLISATRVAAKFKHDMHWHDDEFAAQVGGFQTEELSRLEEKFETISLVVSSELYAAAVSAFQRYASSGIYVGG